MSDLPASYPSQHIGRAFSNWLLPYMQSRLHARQFRPLIAHLLCESACNLDCHYCWLHGDGSPAMSEQTAIDAIDWLHDTGCRVVALTGGEPLLRRDFVLRTVRHGANRGMFMYLATNGALLDPKTVDALGEAGIASLNIGVDTVDPREGLGKSLTAIRANVEYLLKKKRRYGYMVLFTVTVCRNNMDDVRQIVEFAHKNGIPVDIHLNEPPFLEQPHYAYVGGNNTGIRREDARSVDALIKWLVEKNQQGYAMVNSVDHLQRMKDFVRGKGRPWECRAGRNTCVVLPDGKLAPCATLAKSPTNWGKIGEPAFDTPYLRELNKVCNAHCMSTCQFVAAYYYNNTNIARWVLAQVLRQIRTQQNGGVAASQ